MDVMISSSSTKPKTLAFIKSLQKDYPQFGFKKGGQDYWSPGSKTIIYNPEQSLIKLQYSLSHELAHALLNHKNYKSDFELLKMESEAWHKAAELSHRYGFTISDEHIQNCLDTYRDWLHRRSTCPTCGLHVLQVSPNKYRCFNCQTQWTVTDSRFVRAYRRLFKNQKHSG